MNEQTLEAVAIFVSRNMCLNKFIPIHAKLRDGGWVKWESIDDSNVETVTQLSGRFRFSGPLLYNIYPSDITTLRELMIR